VSKAFRADLWLLLITMIWGGVFPLIHDAMQFIAPASFVFFRFLCAALVLLPFVWFRFSSINRRMLIAGILLGILNYGIYVFISIGLVTMPSARSAFIVGTSTAMVPFLMPLLGLGLPRLSDGVAICFCLLGLYLLTGTKLASITPGDLWVLAAAGCVALNVVIVQWATQHTDQALLLTFIQIVATLPLTAIGLNTATFSAFLYPSVIIALLYTSLVATVFTLFIQMRFQKDTTPIKASIIFALMPLFTSLFAWAFNDERLALHVALGGGLVLLSVIGLHLWRHLSVTRRLSA